MYDHHPCDIETRECLVCRNGFDTQRRDLRDVCNACEANIAEQDEDEDHFHWEIDYSWIDIDADWSAYVDDGFQAMEKQNVKCA
jgi:hypothetical protein